MPRPLRAADGLAAAILLTVAGSLTVPLLAQTRNKAGRAKSADQQARIVDAQAKHAEDANRRGQPERFASGLESDASVGGASTLTGGGAAVNSVDASRAFILLARRGYVRSLHAFVDPGDPFVAALDLDPQDLAPGDVDFPEEGKPADADWASPGSPARKDPRHTFYSYSLQAGHSNMRAHPGLRLSQKLPLIGDRNPYHAVYKELTGGKAVTADSKAGNPWSHNRETAVVAFVDGRSEEVAANALEVPMNGADSPAFDILPDHPRPPRRPARGPAALPPAQAGRQGCGDAQAGLRSPLWRRGRERRGGHPADRRQGREARRGRIHPHLGLVAGGLIPTGDVTSGPTIPRNISLGARLR